MKIRDVVFAVAFAAASRAGECLTAPSGRVTARPVVGAGVR